MMRSSLILGAALLALAACGRGGEAQRQAGSAHVSMSGTPADITISTPNGTAEIHAGAAALANLPEGVPAYPNADAGQAIDINGGSAQGHGRVIGFGSHDSPAQVVAFYAQSLGAAGYTIANQMSMGPTASLVAQHGQGQSVSIVATEAGGSTRVEIIAGTTR
jgi:hypothetical protein